MNETVIRKKIVFYGWVQGVGFRYRAYHAANSFGATGWVKNNYDGSVSMEIQDLRRVSWFWRFEFWDLFEFRWFLNE